MAKEYTKERVLAFLNENEVSYDVQEHGAVHTMADDSQKPGSSLCLCQ